MPAFAVLEPPVRTGRPAASHADRFVFLRERFSFPSGTASESLRSSCASFRRHAFDGNRRGRAFIGQQISNISLP